MKFTGKAQESMCVGNDTSPLPLELQIPVHSRNIGLSFFNHISNIMPPKR
jgi:hypothetical protein